MTGWMLCALYALASAALVNGTAIETRADVEVSDGSVFEVTTHYVHPRRALYHARYPDGREALLEFEGEQYWQDDGTGRRPAEPSRMLREFILGHQVHAYLLDFEAMAGRALACQELTVGGEVQNGLTVRDGEHARSLLPCGGRPERMVFEHGDTRVELTFADFRDHQDHDLPFTVVIDDGERQFTYRYWHVELALTGRADSPPADDQPGFEDDVESAGDP